MIERVAYLSLHTSPLLRPGVGDAGGMNVYIHELACTMAARQVDVIVFTRRTSLGDPTEVLVEPRYRVVHIDAGPAETVAMRELKDHVAGFAESVVGWTLAQDRGFDLVHSHYWLSGWAGVLVKETLGVPLANSFHTLGRIKDLARRVDEPPSSALRTLTEEEVIARSDCVIASTPFELDDLLEHYGAGPERLCTSPPGIDHQIFTPGEQSQARRWLGLGPEPLALFAGRIQAHKGVDVAVRAVAALDGVHLAIVGGPSGPRGRTELDDLQQLARSLGAADRIHFLPPQPHHQLADFYRAADVLLMPSRSESFGLVAAEAQACGLPVVAANVGGIPYVVTEGESGLLVDGHEPDGYAKAVASILEDDVFAAGLRTGAIAKAEDFSWPATVDRLLELYEGITAS